MAKRFDEIGSMFGSGVAFRIARSVLWFALPLGVSGCAPKEAGESCVEHKSQCAKGLECDSGVCRACAQSASCIESGRCAFFADECVVTAAGCQDSTGCKTRGLCTVWQGACVAKIPEEPRGDEKEGGCPCGCDHSQAMVTDLEGVAPDEALGEARRSLAVIAERESAGYITDAMVVHRLRLRELERARSTDGEPFLARIGADARALLDVRARRASRSVGDITLREELIVFGATVDIVDGRPKELAPCFRLWLSLENAGTEETVVTRPTLSGSVRFDVRRWYVEGTDGAPWDGVLAPGEGKSVLVIGYIDEAIAPGAVVDASYAIGDAIVETSVSALGRWDARL